MIGALVGVMLTLWQPLPAGAQREFGPDCSMLVGDTTIVRCADGREETS